MRRIEYEPALDGIRTIAIMAVLFFHCDVSWLHGGFLGVDVFFVLSGYLITRLLLAERASTGRIALGGFYIRRAKRLLPALIAMLVTAATCASLYLPDAALQTIRDLPWALTGLSNWWFVFHHQSYFDAMGRPAILQHTWSLAVEFQFYWLWPILLSLLLSISGELVITAVALLCAVASAIALGVVQSSSHAYFGTDTHSIGLFLGSALAASLCSLPSRWKARVQSRTLLLDLSGGVALILLFVLFILVGEETNTRYRAGLLFAELSTLLVIIAATFTNGLINRGLSFQPIVWIGKRSYSLYVWHWPIFQATRPQIDVRLDSVPDMFLRLALTFCVAELSYRYIETPIRRGALGRMMASVRSRGRLHFATAGALTVAGLLLIAVTETRLAYSAIRTNAESLKPLVATAALPVPTNPVQSPLRVGEQDLHTLPALVVGDSVLLNVSPFFKQQLNIVQVDATVGRQAKELYARINGLSSAGHLPPVVILDLGNNGTVEEDTLRGILNDLNKCKAVIVVNARVPRRWQDDNDRLLARIVPSYPNAQFADWRTASDHHPEYFGADGVHPDITGARAYADLVVSTLQNALPRKTADQAEARNKTPAN